MAVFKIKVIKEYKLEQNKLEEGMNVELFCYYPNPTIYNGIYIYHAFVKKYDFDLKGKGWNTTEFLEIEELDNSKLENLIKELALLKIEKANLSFAHRYEDVAMLRDLEKIIVQQIETLKINSINFKNNQEK